MTIIVVGCAGNKLNGKHKAGELYKSSRISFVRRQAHIANIPLFILSAKYGLVYEEKVIESYDLKMDETQANLLINNISEIINKAEITKILFFKAGINAWYSYALEQAIKQCGRSVELIAAGYGNMGDSKKFIEIIKNSKGESCATA